MRGMKMIFAPAAVLLCVLFLASSAFADGPINPYFDEARSMMLDQRLRETYALSVEVSFPENVQTGQKITITAEASGGSGNYSYLFQIASLAVDIENSLKPHLFQHDYSASNTVQFTFWVPDDYFVIALAIDNEDNTKKGNSMPSIHADSSNLTVTGENYLAERVAQIVSECPPGNNFEKALWLHDFIINNAEYDNDLNYYTADGLLLLGTAVCDGYSRAYNLLLAQAGIGYARVESTTHSWNAVELTEGEWYHVDTTWDDPGGSAAPDRYFFGLPTEIVSHISNHVPDFSKGCYFP